MQIQAYNKIYQQQVIDLILNIQQNEFNVPVTINDQPDLFDVENFYCSKNGNFWTAVDDDKVIGTIALIDIDNNQSCLRKMFVHKDYRGKEKGTGQLLLDTLITWCKEKDIREIYLGTIERLEAAIKFYKRNNFVQVNKKDLPENFPIMKVDTHFFKLVIA
jgi:N-acetylglutamate synthase-like GNAT family acetyltransferase